MDLLAQARSSSELEILLNYDPQQPPHQIGDHMSLARLKVAIAHDQKQVQIYFKFAIYLSEFKVETMRDHIEINPFPCDKTYLFIEKKS